MDANVLPGVDVARRVLVAAAVVLAALATGCTSENDVSTATSSSTVLSVQSTVTTAPTTKESTRPPTTTTLTTSATTVRATTTTTRTVPRIDLNGLVLRSDGLGIVSIDEPMEDAIATLIDLLGPPSGDRLIEAPFGEEGEMGGGQMACWTATGTTCIDYLRVVSWDALGLYVVFSDWTEPAPGAKDWELTPATPNMRGYAYFGGTDEPVLATTDGVTIGATVDDLANAYGDRLRFSYDECAFNIAGFEVFDHADEVELNSNSGINWGLWGELSGLPEEPESAVTSFGAGSLLGHC